MVTPRRYSPLGITLALALAAASPALAQPAEGAPAQEAPAESGTDLAGLGDTALIETLLGAGEVSADLFAESFLAQVPLEQIRALLADLRATMGDPVSVTGAGMEFTARSATHVMAVTMVRDATGRIAGLFFGAPDATSRGPEDILEDIGALAPQAAWLVTRDGAVLHAQNAGEALAVGSAFKLGILKALMESIEAGNLSWNDVHRLDARRRSLPTGILQTFPHNAPVTLHTLAALMISQSDNTATDALMGVVGRDAVGEALGLTAPITTRELFVLKADAELRADYLALDEDDEEGREALFARVAEAPLPGAIDIMGAHNPGVEWYLSLETLCALMDDVAASDVFSINPGPVRAADWESVAYKGGSETGVLNLTTRLVAETGETYCVAMTLNAPEAIDEATAIALYGALTTRLAAPAPAVSDAESISEAESNSEAESISEE